MEATEELPEEEKALARELAEIAHELASEHGIATYGRPVEGLTPWDICDEGMASETLEKTRRAAELAKQIVERKEG